MLQSCLNPYFFQIVDHPDSQYKNFLGDVLFGKDTDVKLSLGDALRQCRANKAVYSALKLENLVNITDTINIREVGEFQDSFIMNRITGKESLYHICYSLIESIK